MILAKDYVISGVKLGDGGRVYAAVDHHSGGYLYWSEKLAHAARYTEPTRPTDSYLTTTVEKIEILEVTSTAVIITGDDLIERARQKAAEKIAAANAELQEELDRIAKG